MSYTIVDASPGDAGTLADVSIRSYEDAFGEPFYMEREAAVRRWERYMRGEHHPRNAKDPRIVYAAMVGGEMAGFIAGHLTERFGLEGELQSIYVLPAHQRKGLGTRLAIALARWFQQWDARQVCVDHAGESEHFYLKLGARPNGRGWLVWDDFPRDTAAELKSAGPKRPLLGAGLSWQTQTIVTGNNPRSIGHGH